VVAILWSPSLQWPTLPKLLLMRNQQRKEMFQCLPALHKAERSNQISNIGRDIRFSNQSLTSLRKDLSASAYMPIDNTRFAQRGLGVDTHKRIQFFIQAASKNSPRMAHT
jgi:hypothetical protein